MATNVLKQAQILVTLEAGPLDRIRLMKTLFLVWYRNGQPSSGPFNFVPYLFGPCALDLYSTLEDMEYRGLIVQMQHPNQRWGRYYLTAAGKEIASKLTIFDIPHKEQIIKIARWASKETFQSLLDAVYREAPEYASKSVLRREAHG